MSNWFTLRLKSGGLTTSSLDDFWTIGNDPKIPNLPLGGIPVAVSQGGAAMVNVLAQADLMADGPSLAGDAQGLGTAEGSVMQAATVAGGTLAQTLALAGAVIGAITVSANLASAMPVAGAAAASGTGAATFDVAPMPNSEISYAGASATNAFVAIAPYVVNIQGVNTTIDLYGPTGTQRKFDYSGNLPFIDPATDTYNIRQMQGWDPAFPNNNNNLNGDQLTNAGFPGRVDKQTVNGVVTTMTRYNAGNGITYGKCRSQINGFFIPPRVHAKWDIEVAFGNGDGTNDWYLEPIAGTSPVLFWQIHSDNQENPPLAIEVDTDPDNTSKLKLSVKQRSGGAAQPSLIGSISGLPRHTMTTITVEAFLDERLTAAGGKGRLQVWINGNLIVDQTKPNLAAGTLPHWWAITTYLWNNPSPYSHTRAIFWKTARMKVFPSGT